MNYTQQEIADLVARKCQEALAPLYAELEELQVQYGMREAEPQPPATLIVTLISLYNIEETTSQFKHDARIMQIATTIRGVWY